MSHYAEYIKERENKEIIENEKGFVTYQFLNDACYIETVYIHPDYRRSGVASEFGDQIAAIAKAKGYKKMYGSCSPSTNGSTESLVFLLKYGFKLDSCTNNFIVLVKEI